jgi:hypothetical protein
VAKGSGDGDTKKDSGCLRTPFLQLSNSELDQGVSSKLWLGIGHSITMTDKLVTPSESKYREGQIEKEMAGSFIV